MMWREAQQEPVRSFVVIRTSRNCLRRMELKIKRGLARPFDGSA